MFVVVGGTSVLFYGKWRAWVDMKRSRMRTTAQIVRQEVVNNRPGDVRIGKGDAVPRIADEPRQDREGRDKGAQHGVAEVHKDGPEPVEDRTRHI